MKIRKLIGFVLVVLSILLALNIVSFAIGFEAETIFNSVFLIESEDSLGCGFAVGKNCIITNAHVLKNIKKISITSYDGNKLDATVFALDEERDIAIIAVHNKQLVPLLLSGTEKTIVGKDVYAIGAPKTLSYTLTKGVVSSKDRKIGNYSYLQTDAAINEGNSGGPLVDDSGNVIGMNSMKLTNSEGIGLAIPSEMIVEYLKESGINIDEKGFVSEIKTLNKSVEEKPTESSNIEEKNTVEKTIKSYKWVIPWVCFGCSAFFNVIFLIYIIYKKQKNIEKSLESSDRTDFDIDILD